MKNIILLSMLYMLSSCITINQGGSGSPSPRLFTGKAAAAPMMASDGGGGAGGTQMAYRASMTITSFKPERIRQEVITDTLLLKGEIVHDSSEHMIVRVPTEHLSNMIENLKKLGKTESIHFRGENIKTPVEDTSARLESLLLVRAQYQAALAKAEAVQDILAANRDLEQINYQIQALQNQKRDFDLQTKYSELTVVIKKRKMFGPLGWVLYGAWCAVKWLFWWG
ncbi:MAG: DUF4349 domain-containing protein [Brevinema sp.]